MLGIYPLTLLFYLPVKSKLGERDGLGITYEKNNFWLIIELAR